MLERYMGIMYFLPSIEIDKMTSLLPSRRDDMKLKKLMETLRDIDSVTKILQRESATMAETFVLLDEVFVHYEEVRDRLWKHASTLDEPIFENTFVKIQESQVDIGTTRKSKAFWDH